MHIGIFGKGYDVQAEQFMDTLTVEDKRMGLGLLPEETEEKKEKSI